MSMEQSLAEAAVQLAKVGAHVHPLIPGGKTPLSKHGVKDATRDIDQIHKWWEASPDANIGISCWPTGIVVIDVDTIKPECQWNELEAALGSLPETLTVRTRSGGFHYYFKAPDGVEVASSAGKLAKGVDIRAKGGYVVAPPSHFTARSAEDGPSGDYSFVTEAKVSDLPQVWLDAILSSRSPLASGQSGNSQPIKKAGGAVSALTDATTKSLMGGDSPPPETHENIEIVKAMLECVGADSDREEWLHAMWAVRATGWADAYDIARKWSASCPDKFDEKGFERDWESWREDGGVGYGTLVHLAKKRGYTGPARSTTNTTQADLGGEGDVKGDLLNAKLFAQLHRGRLLFIYESGNWLLFEAGGGWVKAPPDEETRAAKSTIREINDRASDMLKQGDMTKARRCLAHATHSSSKQRIDAMISLAKAEEGMTRRASEFDADEWLLGVANGVLDLRKGVLLPVTPDVLVSKRAAVAFDQAARCPTWEAFMQRIQPDEVMRGYIQALAGACLTGDVSAQKMFFLHGTGANGKSVFVETIAGLLGEYALKIPTEMLMRNIRSPQGPSPDLVALKGRRMIYCNETSEGRQLDEARVKELTGGDTITGRSPYAPAAITFRPTHKLIVVGNHQPEIRDTGEGLWRRVALVGFNEFIPEGERDKGLQDKLNAETSGILNWCLAGLKHFLQHGLMEPEQVRQATQIYRTEQDLFGEFVSDCLGVSNAATVRAGDLYEVYRKWCASNGHHPLAKDKVTRRLKERGICKAPDRRSYQGVKLSEGGEQVRSSYPFPLA